VSDSLAKVLTVETTPAEPAVRTPKIIEELAEQLAMHRIVPFIGAGCSVQLTGFDWDGIRDEMCSRLAVPTLGHQEAATQFARRFGQDGLADLLRGKLLLSSFDQEKGAVLIGLMSMNLITYYTTNQDNSLELCFQTFGRPLARIVGIDDFAALVPGDSVLYKFHGTTDHADSLVFTEDQYAARLSNPNHPMDIRLRSDALSKSLLFIGYSFRDPNVQALLRGLHGVFGGHLPQSYLIQYAPSEDWARDLKAAYGITAISCPDEFPDSASPAEAFERFISTLANETALRKGTREIEDFFEPKLPVARRVVTKFDMGAVEQAVARKSLAEATRVFRAVMDGALVPDVYHHRASDCFVQLCKQVTSRNEAQDLGGGLFNLHIGPAYAVLAQGALIATSNDFPPMGMLDVGMMVTSQVVPDEFLAVSSAYAIALLEEWKRPLRPGLFSQIAWLQPRFKQLSDLPPKVGEFVQAQFASAFQPGKTTMSNPLGRRVPVLGGARGYRDILSLMMNSVPKRMPTPYDPR